MSPRYRFGHTSSPWRQERGAECKISSSSWRDGILFESSVTHLHFSSSSGSVSRTFLCSESCVTYLTSEAAPGIGFMSVIYKFRGKLFCSFPKSKSHCRLLPLLWLLTVSDCQKQVVQFGTDPQPSSHTRRCVTGYKTTACACFVKYKPK